jgi:hypothetical protein
MAGVEEVRAVGLGPILNYNRPYRLVFAVVVIIIAVMLAVSCGAIDLVACRIDMFTSTVTSRFRDRLIRWMEKNTHSGFQGLSE